MNVEEFIREQVIAIQQLAPSGQSHEQRAAMTRRIRDACQALHPGSIDEIMRSIHLAYPDGPPRYANIFIKPQQDMGASETSPLDGWQTLVYSWLCAAIWDKLRQVGHAQAA